MSSTYSNLELYTVRASGLQPFDDRSLANSIGLSPRLLWYCVLLPDAEKYTKHLIPKRKGGYRLIHAPNEITKYSLKILNNYLTKFQEELPEYVAAYRVKHTIKNAVQRHIPYCAICNEGGQTKKHSCPKKGAYLQLDLKDFFNRTKYSWVLECLHDDLGMEYAVADIIASMVTVRDIPAPLAEEPDRMRRAVPQGAPTSGTICNLVAYYRLDIKLIEYLNKLDEKYGLTHDLRWVYTRYADDLAFTCGRDFSFKEKIDIIQDIANIIWDAGYKVNSRKTRIKNPAWNKELLGITFNHKVTISREKYMKLRAIVHNCLVYGIDTQFGEVKFPNTEAFIHWLRGKIAYVKHVDPSKGSGLHAEFIAAVEQYRNSNAREISRDMGAGGTEALHPGTIDQIL